jgi:tetratricopeptide (TPR) repeat protein
LSSIPLVALIGAGCRRLWIAPGWWKRGALALAVSVLGLFCWQTTRQIGFWRDSETLWTRVLAYEPANTEAYNNRASARYDRGEFDKALADYDAAIRYPPRLGRAHALKRRAAYFNDRAITYVRLRRYGEAIADEGEAIALRPGDASYYANRANMFLLAGKPAEALDDLDHAVAISPAADPALLRKRDLLHRRLH